MLQEKKSKNLQLKIWNFQRLMWETVAFKMQIRLVSILSIFISVLLTILTLRFCSSICDGWHFGNKKVTRPKQIEYLYVNMLLDVLSPIEGDVINLLRRTSTMSGINANFFHLYDRTRGESRIFYFISSYFLYLFIVRCSFESLELSGRELISIQVKA